MKVGAAISALVLALSCAGAAASDWVAISEGSAGTLQIDRDSLISEGTRFVEFWYKAQFHKPMDVEGAVFDRTMSHVSVDCDKRTFTSNQTEVYLGGTHLDTIGRQRKQAIVPDSNMDMMATIVCTVVRKQSLNKYLPL